MRKLDKVEKLSHILGYSFNQPKLLLQALTHRSAHTQHNERLEFLGDSILNFLIAEVLYQAREYAQEGELSRLRASLVKGDTLAQIAKEIHLGDYLILGSGELKTGGQQRDSILADAFEAVVGAIYLDSDINRCKEVILPLFSSRLADMATLKLKDPKTQLQEILQAKSLALPEYRVISMEGEPHEQFFIVECVVTALSLISEGRANSRRRAEQEAARAMLNHFPTKRGKHD